MLIRHERPPCQDPELIWFICIDSLLLSLCSHLLLSVFCALPSSLPWLFWLYPCLLFLTLSDDTCLSGPQFSRLACLSLCASVCLIIYFQCLLPLSPIHFSFCIAPAWNPNSLPGLHLVQTPDSSGDGSEPNSSHFPPKLFYLCAKSLSLLEWIFLKDREQGLRASLLIKWL